uniref:Uncharacterized protein n=1 Tax=Brassica oleracea var. oleracea TaxID=109376 RepID=A0A0D3CIV5_BRAOL
MSGDSSNTSGASTGVSSSRRRVEWSTEFRRDAGVLENDNHIFKWTDEALINEVEKLEFKNARLEEELREMRRSEILLGERVQMKVEKELFDKVEEVLAEAKGSMKKLMLSAVVGGVVLVGIMELCLKSW